MHSECNGWLPILTSKLFCAEITEPVSSWAAVHCRVTGAICFSAYRAYLSPVSKNWYIEAVNRLGAGTYVCRVVTFGTTTSGCMQSQSYNNLELTIPTTTTLPPQCWPGGGKNMTRKGVLESLDNDSYLINLAYVDMLMTLLYVWQSYLRHKKQCHDESSQHVTAAHEEIADVSFHSDLSVTFVLQRRSWVLHRFPHKNRIVEVVDVVTYILLGSSTTVRITEIENVIHLYQ